MKIKTNDVEITIRKMKTAQNQDGLNILLTSAHGHEDSLCHILPDAEDSQILIINAAVARKHKVGFNVIDNSW